MNREAYLGSIKLVPRSQTPNLFLVSSIKYETKLRRSVFVLSQDLLEEIWRLLCEVPLMLKAFFEARMKSNDLIEPEFVRFSTKEISFRI